MCRSSQMLPVSSNLFDCAAGGAALRFPIGRTASGGVFDTEFGFRGRPDLLGGLFGSKWGRRPDEPGAFVQCQRQRGECLLHLVQPQSEIALSNERSRHSSIERRSSGFCRCRIEQSMHTCGQRIILCARGKHGDVKRGSQLQCDRAGKRLFICSGKERHEQRLGARGQLGTVGRTAGRGVGNAQFRISAKPDVCGIIFRSEWRSRSNQCGPVV